MGQLDQLERLNRLRESGTLSDEEFERQKAQLLSGEAARQKWLWISASAVLAAVAIGLFIASQRGSSTSTSPAAVTPRVKVEVPKQVGPSSPPTPPPCVAPGCRVLSPEGWATVRVGMRVDAAMRTAGLRLRRPGHYDEFFQEEPERLRACNIYGIVGAPENISAFVENGILTSIGVDDPSESDNGGEIFQTDRGVRLGDPESAVRRAYPRLQQESDIYRQPPDKKLFYRGPNGRGIKFSIVDGRVEAINVGLGSINYVEGCL